MLVPPSNPPCVVGAYNSANYARMPYSVQEVTTKRRLPAEIDARLQQTLERWEDMYGAGHGAADHAGRAQVRQLCGLLLEEGKLSRDDFGRLLRSSLLQILKRDAAAKVGAVVDGLSAQSPEAAVALKALVLSAMGRFDWKAPQLLKRLFDTLDKDQSGFLDEQELEPFLRLAEAGTVAQMPPSLQDMAFDLLGPDGNGAVSVDEVAVVLRSLVGLVGQTAAQLLDVVEDCSRSPDVRHALESAPGFGCGPGMDANQDGVISRKEWTAFVQKLKLGCNVRPDSGPRPSISTLTHRFLGMWNGTCGPACGKLFAAIVEAVPADKMAILAAFIPGGLDEGTVLPHAQTAYQDRVRKNEEGDGLERARKLLEHMREAQKKVDQLKTTMIGGEPNLLGVLDLPGQGLSEEHLQTVWDSPEFTQVRQELYEEVHRQLPILVHRVFQLCDINSDGKVSSTELESLNALKQALMGGDVEASADALFNMIDADGNGSLSRSEVLGFGVKLLQFACAIFRLLQLCLEVALPAVLDQGRLGAQKLGIATVTKDQLLMMCMMAMAAKDMLPRCASKQG